MKVLGVTFCSLAALNKAAVTSLNKDKAARVHIFQKSPSPRDSGVAIGVAISRMENPSDAKIRENEKENGKWPQAGNGQKMAAENGKNGPQNGIVGVFLPFWRPVFGHFGPGAIFHFLSHFPGIWGS